MKAPVASCPLPVARVDRREPRVTVKICGLTSASDARAAHEAGADFLGFVFFPASRRCLAARDCEWVRGVPGAKVGVFRDQDSALVAAIRERAGLELVQLHGDESVDTCRSLGGRERVIKAISVAERVDWERVRAYAGVARLLFDTASPTGGGTGRAFDWELLAGRPSGLALWLAGGLRPGNVGEAVRRVRPAGVDVASGVEREIGRKDPATIRAFIAAVRAAEHRLDGRKGLR
jgi:phosphoribosylanthranilate isomerase